MCVVKTEDRLDTVFKSIRLRFAHMQIHIHTISTITITNMENLSCLYMPIDFDTISTINIDSFCSVYMQINIDTKFK